MSVASFYATSRWGMRFNARYKLGGSWHYSCGMDIEDGAGVEVPSLYDGRVVARYTSSIIGYVIVVQHGDLFFAYCHVINRIPVGRRVAAGTAIARVASAKQMHGSAWTGPHVAVHVSSRSARDAAFGTYCIDPEPYIYKALKPKVK